VTHFFASTGTCGTITGNSRFLKHMSGGRVKVYGVHPEKTHDVPGVRAIEQLKLTDHYKPDEYDGLVEVSNQEAFDMCVRLNREESMIAGPSSGMQVVAAMKTMKDEPGNVGVVVFCDDIFKYTASVERHCPAIFSKGPAAPTFEPAVLSALRTVMETLGQGGDTVSDTELKRLATVLSSSGGSSSSTNGALSKEAPPLILDVRSKEEFGSRLRPRGAVNVPAAELFGQTGAAASEEVVQVFDVPGGVQRRSGSDAQEPPEKTRRVENLSATLRTALGRDVGSDEPILLVCNRGIDSGLALLLLKAAGYKAAQHVDRGMFAWREAELPTEEDSSLVDLPPANDKGEEEVLERLGYGSSGQPNCRS